MSLQGLGLLVGHLLGDYIFQDDWQAANKTNPSPGPHPAELGTLLRAIGSGPIVRAELSMREYLPDLPESENVKVVQRWEQANRRWWVGHLACAMHCTLYTLAVWLCSCWWLPWWGLAVCWLAHFPVDRWRLARRLMRWRHEGFATGPLSPWSVVIVDNTIHLAVLFAIGLAAGGTP